MVRSNDFSFNIAILLNGVAVNCNSGFLRMTVKWRPQDSDANKIFALTSPSTGITWVSQSGGTATVKVPHTATAITAIPFHQVNPYYDIQFTDGSGNIYTVAYGILTINPNISQSSP